MPDSRSTVVVGVVHTMDDRMPVAEAFAMSNGRIVFVGSADDALAAVGAGAEVIRPAGGAILPGLVDAHNHHAVAGAEDLFQLRFPPTASVAEIAAAVAAYQEGLPEGAWVVGGLWGSHLVDELGTAEPLRLLDAATGDRPVVLTDDSHHNKWANTAALRAAGILDAPDPEGGTIVRDPDGKPTGLLLESASAPVERARAADAPSDLAHHVRCSARGVDMLAEHGVVAFQDAAAGIDMLRALKQLDDTGQLHAWVATSLLINDPIFANSQVGHDLLPHGAAYATGHHRPIWSKIFLDGVPPARTAAFVEPYLPGADDEGEERGETTMTREEVEGWLRSAHGLGLGVKVHCTGDASVRLLLDATETVRAEGLDVRVQIAHGQFVQKSDIPRVARLGVTAEISPFLWFPGVIASVLHACLPATTFGRIQPNRELRDAGARIAVGTDWPVSPSPNLWHAVAGLVTRTDPTGEFPGSLAPDQALTRAEAIRAITSDAADAIGFGDVTGRIRVGNSADFVVLDRDPFDVAVESLGGTVVRETWFAGERVFSRE